MYKIDRRGGGQKSFSRTDPNYRIQCSSSDKYKIDKRSRGKKSQTVFSLIKLYYQRKKYAKMCKFTQYYKVTILNRRDDKAFPARRVILSF